MSKAFLPTILEQKEKEVAQLVMEDLQPLRQTYVFMIFSSQIKTSCKLFLKWKKLVQVWVILT